MILKTIATACISVAFLTATSPSSGQPEQTPSSDPASHFSIDGIDERFRWYHNEYGVVLSENTQSAEKAMEEMAAAAATFQHYFAKQASKGAIIDSRYASQSREIRQALEVDWVLPWRFDLTELSRQQEAPVSEQQRAAIRQQIQTQLSSAGNQADAAQVDALVEQAVAKLKASKAETKDPASIKPLRHEVAHQLFIAGIWPAENPLEQYAGGAPDWLDEAAAVLAEGPALTRIRRQQFYNLADQGRLTSLEHWFAMPHPIFAAARRLIEQRQGDQDAGGVYTFSMSELEASGVSFDSDASDFYAQARGFVDFLDQHSHDQYALASIARLLRDNHDMQSLLQNHGETLGLPTSIAGLERDFLAWAEAGTKAKDGATANQ